MPVREEMHAEAGGILRSRLRPGNPRETRWWARAEAQTLALNLPDK